MTRELPSEVTVELDAAELGGPGSHYDHDNNSSNPSGMSSESLHSGLRMGVYVVYEVGSETYVRRGGVWVKA